MNFIRRIWDWFYDEDVPPWGWLSLAALGFLVGTVLNWQAKGSAVHSLGMACGLLSVVAAFGAYRHRRWAAWLGLGVLVALVGFSIFFLIVLGTSARRVVGIFGGLYLLWDFWRQTRLWTEDEPDSDQERPTPLVSLVLLLKEPMHLDATILARIASKAWDAEVQTIDETGDDDSGVSFVGGDSPHFIGSHGGGFFAIHNFDQPYFEDVENIANAVTELRRQKAIREHTAWVSCDLIHWLEPSGELGEAYRLIARLLCELLDDNCLAIIDPEAQQVFLNDPETESKLRSPDPRAALQESYYVPVIAVAPDDPRMLAAVAEARSRFEEFVTAFEQREESGIEFFVKSPFSENDVTEFMWLKVEAIENGVIYGSLGNDPNDIPSLREGSRVTAKTGELNDWIIQPPSGDFIGGFTIHVLSEQAEEQNDESEPNA